MMRWKVYVRGTGGTASSFFKGYKIKAIRVWQLSRSSADQETRNLRGEELLFIF
jgi:hypothetical protein